MAHCVSLVCIDTHCHDYHVACFFFCPPIHQVLQRELRSQRGGCSCLLQVAHRLYSVMDHDKILVLERGKVRGV
jgi:hypothetical protein